MTPDKFANLSPEEKRAALAKLLQKKAGVVSAPVSLAQQRLWFLDQLLPGNISYNIFRAWRLTGTLDRAALDKALDELVRRHESLRTTFSTVEGQPVQLIAPAAPRSWPWQVLSALPPEQREAQVRRLVLEEAERPFELVKGPLLRVTVLELSEQEHVLLLALHHILSDGWSMGVLVRELSALYRAFSSGERFANLSGVI